MNKYIASIKKQIGLTRAFLNRKKKKNFSWLRLFYFFIKHKNQKEARFWRGRYLSQKYFDNL